jgi:hypothetical protein
LPLPPNRRIDEGEMPKVSFDLRTAVPPERVMAMLTDFSPNRPEIWPMLAPELYEVHRLDAGSASVKARVQSSSSVSAKMPC